MKQPAKKHRQPRIPLDRTRMRRLFNFLALRAAGSRPLARVTLVLTDHAGMIRANKQHLGRTGTTDVIAFPHLPMPGETQNALRGDIIVNKQLAMEEGARRKNPAHELALYIAHGLNHLAGGSDATAVNRRKMRRRELAWLADACKEGLLPQPQTQTSKQRNQTSRISGKKRVNHRKR